MIHGVHGYSLMPQLSIIVGQQQNPKKSKAAKSIKVSMA